MKMKHAILVVDDDSAHRAMLRTPLTQIRSFPGGLCKLAALALEFSTIWPLPDMYKRSNYSGHRISNG